MEVSAMNENNIGKLDAESGANKSQALSVELLKLAALRLKPELLSPAFTNIWPAIYSQR
jgi:hypothetical protein